MGSVADKIIRGAPCPVLTMREVPAAEAAFAVTASALEGALVSSPSPL
jgi:hypothetical protein